MGCFIFVLFLLQRNGYGVEVLESRYAEGEWLILGSKVYICRTLPAGKRMRMRMSYIYPMHNVPRFVSAAGHMSHW